MCYISCKLIRRTEHYENCTIVSLIWYELPRLRIMIVFTVELLTIVTLSYVFKFNSLYFESIGTYITQVKTVIALKRYFTENFLY